MPLSYRLLVPALVAAAIACGGDADTDARPAASSPPAAGGARLGGSSDADVAEVSGYRLTMDAVRRMHQAQLAIYQAMQQNPELAQLASMEAEEFSLDAVEERFSSVPEIRQAIEGAGLSVREYGVIMVALFQASFAQASLEMGAPRDSVLASTDMNPDNLDFVGEHRDELRRLQEELAVAAREAGGDTPSRQP